MVQYLLSHLPVHISFFETGASFWHGRARKEMEFDEWTFNEFMNIEKSMKGNQVSLIVKLDLDQARKPIF